MRDGKNGFGARDLIEWHARFALLGIGMCAAGVAIHGARDLAVGRHPQDMQAIENMGLALTGSGGATIALCTVAASWVLVSRLTLRLWK